MNDIRNAIDAGNKAIDCLYMAQKELESAKDWGLWDMFGGGLISSMAKHSKMNRADECIKEAEDLLRVFNDYVATINGSEINLDTKDVVGICDVFCDGLVFDFLMQSRINEARTSVDSAIREIDIVVKKLKEHVE